MHIKDFIFEPHNDISNEDIDLVTQHDDLIKQSNYSDATTLLDENNYKKGFRASLFNSIQNKIREIETYLLNKYIADDDEFYSLTEPTDEQMGNKEFWIQEY